MARQVGNVMGEQLAGGAQRVQKMGSYHLGSTCNALVYVRQRGERAQCLVLASGYINKGKFLIWDKPRCALASLEAIPAFLVLL